MDRRPLKTRSKVWAQNLARILAAMQITPNQISLMSIGCASCAGVALLLHHWGWAAFFIQLRLLCNLMDGMVAIEYHKHTRIGEIFNELPDRISDVLILVCAGYACIEQSPWAPVLGWFTAVVAVLTAYIRNLGTAIGTRAYFNGPMAKPHRMFVLTCACLGATVLTFHAAAIMVFGMGVIAIGSVVTCANRLKGIIHEQGAA